MVRVTNCSDREFERKLQEGASVIAFGASRTLDHLCNRYTQLASCIIYVVDNYKSGTISLNGYEIPLQTFDQCENNGESIFLVTPITYADEIIGQLDERNDFDGVDVYVPALFTAEIDNEVIPDIGSDIKQIIPKTIHYCWFGGKELPKKFQQNIDTWKKHCPEYEIIRWDESNYDIHKNPYMEQAYAHKKWGFVPDYARLDIINTYGGIYLDTDIEILKSFDPLLQFPLFCGFESFYFIALGLGFGAHKDNDILKDMMALYDHVSFINPGGSLNLTPSPAYQTEVLDKYGLIRGGQTQIRKEFVALSMEYLNPCGLYGGGRPTSRSFSIHQYAATWYGSKQQEEKIRAERNYQHFMKRLRNESNCGV